MTSLALKENEGPSEPFKKLKTFTKNLDIEYLSYPIKIEFLTKNFYDNFRKNIQHIFINQQYNFELENLKLELVAAKSPIGRVTLAQDLVSKERFMIKSLHRWKLAKWDNDDLFHKLSLNISKYVSNDRLVELIRAFSTPSFLIIILKFYHYGTLFYHIRRLSRFSENVASYFFKEILELVLDYHSNSKVIIGLRSDHIFLDEKGKCRVNVFNGFKFNAFNIQKGKIHDEVSYLCKLNLFSS